MRDSDLEKTFQKDGYIQIPFLSADEVKMLKEKFFELLPQSGGSITQSDLGGDNLLSYDFTFIDRNIEYKKVVFELITKIFASHADKWLAGYRPIIANFIRKKTNTGEVPLHQNWAFVDEHKYTSISIWCPLVDSTIENGTLQVTPGSHKRFGEVRGPMIPWELEGIKHDIIANHLIPLETKAGDAVILDDSIVHYSATNHTTELRLAIQLILIPEEVKSIHHHMNPAKSMEEVEILEVDTDFYMHFNPWKQPEGEHCIEHIRYVPRSISLEDFNKRMLLPRYDEVKTMSVA